MCLTCPDEECVKETAGSVREAEVTELRIRPGRKL